METPLFIHFLAYLCNEFIWFFKKIQCKIFPYYTGCFLIGTGDNCPLVPLTVIHSSTWDVNQQVGNTVIMWINSGERWLCALERVLVEFIITQWNGIPPYWAQCVPTRPIPYLTLRSVLSLNNSKNCEMKFCKDMMLVCWKSS